MSIDKKVTARTGAAGVLVGVAITLAAFSFVSRSADTSGSSRPIGQVVDTTVTIQATTSTVAQESTLPEPTTVPATTAAPRTTAPRSTAPIDQRVDNLEDRVNVLENTTTTSTTFPPTTENYTPTTR